MDKKHIATLTILVKDREMHAPEVNKLLTDHGHLILARLGVNLQRHCIEHCTAMITVAVEGTMDEIRDLEKKIDGFYGIVAKATVMTE